MIWTFLVLWAVASIAFAAGVRWKSFHIEPYVWSKIEGKQYVQFYAKVFRDARVDSMCRLPDIPEGGHIETKIWQLIEGDVLPAGSTCHVELTATDPSVILMGDFESSTLAHSTSWKQEGRTLKVQGDAASHFMQFPPTEHFESPWPINDERGKQ